MATKSQVQTQAGDGTVHENRTAKVIELIGTSTRGFDDAIRHALQDAAETTRGITGCQVENWSVKCENGEIREWRVDLKIAFGVERRNR